MKTDRLIEPAILIGMERLMVTAADGPESFICRLFEHIRALHDRRTLEEWLSLPTNSQEWEDALDTLESNPVSKSWGKMLLDLHAHISREQNPKS